MDTPTKDEVLRLFNYRISDEDAQHLADALKDAQAGRELSPVQEDFLGDAGVLDDE